MNKKLFLYGIFIFSFTIFSYLFVDRNFTPLHFLYSGVSSNYRFLVTAIYTAFVVLFFAFYLSFFKKEMSFPQVKKFILVSLLCLVISYPAIFSFDIFNYMATSKVTYFYKENPYIVMPNEFTNDSTLIFTRATNKVALYGPTWIIVSGIPFILGLNIFLLQLLLTKLLIAFFYPITSFILYKLSKSIKSLIFFALNPLVLVETFVSAHNDIVMMFLALSSFYLLKKKKIFFSLVLLTLSIFVKFATIALMPLFIFVLWKYIKKKEVEWNKIWLYSAILMFLVVLVSPIREELYPWYAVWFIPFVALLTGYERLKVLTIAFSMGLLFSYIPYMYLGHYLFPELLLKTLLIVIPVVIASILVLAYDKKIKKSYF